MSGPFGSSQFMYATGAAEEGQSLRFEDGDSAYLTRTPTTAGNRKTWTWSGWVKLGNIGTAQKWLFAAATSTADYSIIRINSTGTVEYARVVSSALNAQKISSNLLRDPSAWYHIVVAEDCTSSVVQIYVNGSEVSYGTNNNPTNVDGAINNTGSHVISGSLSGIGNGYIDGYLANVTFIDGQALDPTSFGEYQDTLWKPKPDADITSLTFGTNGFYLPFAEDIDAGSSYYFDGSSDYVSYSSASLYDVGSSDDFELECFFNTDMVSGSGDYGYMLGNYDGSSQFMTLQPDFRSANEHFAWYIGNGQAWIWDYTSGDVSPNTWHHLTISRTSGTLRMFLDGVRLTSITSASASNGSISGGNVINNTTSYNLSSFRIGESFAGQKAYDGYVSNVRFIVGSSIRNSDSSFTPPTSTLTDVTNTKLLTATNLTIGDDISSNNNDGSASGNARASGVNPFGTYNFFQDVSGNDNHFAPYNLQYTDVVPDSPVTGGNFATMNPLDKYPTYVTLSEGNLQIDTSASNVGVKGTYFVNSGKWYYEARVGNASGVVTYGAATSSWANTYVGNTGSYGYLSNGFIYVNGSAVQSSVATATTGDIIGIALNMDDNEITFYKNNTQIGTTVTGLADEVAPAFAGQVSSKSQVNFGQDSSFAGNETPQGNGADDEDFYYDPPSGFKSLKTSNLPTPDITAPDEYFNTVLYTGTGTTDQAVTGVGFQPDFTWIKSRSDTFAHWLNDVVRGAGKGLRTDSTDDEYTSLPIFLSFDSDGFTVDVDSGTANNTTNGSGSTFVAWNWKAGGTAVSNTDGSITSSVSANQDAGFSIISFVGDATAGSTVGHGLSSAPEMVISKNRDDVNSWLVYHKDLDASNPEQKRIFLNLTDAVSDSTTPWNDTAPTSSLLTLGTSGYTNGSGDDMIMYAFHSVSGYSKCGVYTGNGSTDGTFVHCGFRPAFVMFKRANATEDWYIADATRDTENDAGRALFPNTSGSEANYSSALDLLSNGFKLRNSGNLRNGSGDTYIFIAFAEAPFKSANAR